MNYFQMLSLLRGGRKNQNILGMFGRNRNNNSLIIHSKQFKFSKFRIGKEVVPDKENFTLDNAAKIVTSKYTGGPSKSITPAVLTETKEEARDLMRSDEIIQSPFGSYRKTGTI